MPKLYDQDFDHVAFMSDPFKWPHLMLPVKKPAENGAGLLCGVMLGDKPAVRLGNFWDAKNIMEWEVMEYESYQAAYDDGWRVD